MFKRDGNYFDNVVQMLKLFERILCIPNMWDLVKGEIIQAEMEPMNSVDKYAVVAIRGGHVIGHLKKGTSRKFRKAILYFLKFDENNGCWVEVTGKRCNLGDEKGMQVPCMLHFEAIKVYFDSLLSKYMKIYCQNLTKLSFLLIYSFVFELMDRNIA